MLAGFSPQFAWNSVLLLPDSVAVLPILLAIIVWRAPRKIRVWENSLSPARWSDSRAGSEPTRCADLPFCRRVPLLIKGERQWRYALAVIFALC